MAWESSSPKRIRVRPRVRDMRCTSAAAGAGMTFHRLLLNGIVKKRPSVVRRTREAKSE